MSGKQLALKNNCDYGQYLKSKGLLEAYRDHVEARGPNSKDPAQTKWSWRTLALRRRRLCRRCDRARDYQRDWTPARLRGRSSFLVRFVVRTKPYDPPLSFLNAIPKDDTTAYIPGQTMMDPQTRERLNRVRRAYKGMIGCIDRQVGLILDKLEQEGLLDSTVILFTSDHGEMLGDHNRMSKMQPWRQSVIVPTAIRHPAYLSAQTCHSPIEITDLTATILDIAGENPQQALAKPWPSFHDRVPCRSLMPIIRGDADKIRTYAFSECDGIWQMVQSDRWKYIRYLNQTPDGMIREELYDLLEDPQEQENLINDQGYTRICAELREASVRIIDATPPAQTGWAPYLAQELLLPNETDAGDA